MSPLPSDTGYRGPTACNAAGITYRQLDYWARTGLVEPTVRGATGSGTQRLYSFRDILILKVIKRLLDAGISLQQIRTAVQHLRERGTDDLTRVTLMSDGASVYECTSNDEVIDLLQGGQGVFGIAIGGVWREIEGTLAELPSERTADDAATPRPATSSPPVGPLARPARLAPADNPARESLRPAAARWRPGRSAEGAIPPRNLSGARTVRTRQLWSRRPHAGRRPTEGEATRSTPECHRGAPVTDHPSLSGLDAALPFVDRHIGLRPADIEVMLERLGFASLDALMEAAVPGGIRAAADLDLPAPLTEEATARELRAIAAANHPARAMIGLGYHATITPPVIRRNVLEDPAGTPPTRRTSRRSPRAGSRRCSTSRR